MTDETKQIVLDALRRYAGDDYERAKRAFSGFSAKQMEEMHGNSGISRGNLLRSYQEHYEAVQKAVAEVVAS